MFHPLYTSVTDHICKREIKILEINLVNISHRAFVKAVQVDKGFFLLVRITFSFCNPPVCPPFSGSSHLFHRRLKPSSVNFTTHSFPYSSILPSIVEDDLFIFVCFLFLII